MSKAYESIVRGLKEVKDMQNNVDKPTVEQVAWVFSKLCECAKDGGTFRYLIYDTMGFEPENYVELYEAGGLTINNAMSEYFDSSKEEPI